MTEKNTLQYYESPKITIEVIEPEGVICASGQFEGWDEENLQ